MSSKEKEDVCNRSDCQWVPTSKEADSYVCLRCQKKWPPPPKPKPKPKPPSPVVVLMALAAALVISLILGSTESQSYQPTHWRHDSWSDGS